MVREFLLHCETIHPHPEPILANEVSLEINSKFVLHKDVEVEIKTDGRKLGTMLVSKGNLEWLPSGNHVNKRRVTWARFAELMETEGKEVKVRAKAKNPVAPK